MAYKTKNTKTAEDKQAEVKEACAKIDGMFQALADGLNCPETEAVFQEHLKAAAKFHKYSFGNIMWLMSQRENITRVAGFHKWKEFNRSVKKGEKGLKILAPSIGRIYLKPEDMGKHSYVKHDKDGKAYVEKPFGFRVEYVFDVSQTEGEPLPELDIRVHGDAASLVGKVSEVIKDLGFTIDFKELSPGLYGYQKGKSLTISSSLSDADTVSTMIHELTHGLLHSDRAELLQRDHSKSILEIEAESVAYIVGTHLGLDMTGAKFYIRSYGQGSKEETLEKLKKSMALIQQTAKKIIEKLEA